MYAVSMMQLEQIHELPDKDKSENRLYEIDRYFYSYNIMIMIFKSHDIALFKS